MGDKCHCKHHKENCCQRNLVDNLTAALKNWKNLKSDANACPPAKVDGRLFAQKIEKRILHGASGPIPDGCKAPGGGLAYPKESKFIFNYLIRKTDEDHTVLDDTRRYGKTMELYSGKEFQLEFWEYCLETMLPGEVASFTVPADHLRSFAAVNKKLRDYMLDKKGPAAKHCCGLMGFQEQGGLGYTDLDELMYKPVPLEFIFELIRVEIPGSVRKEAWIMNFEEKSKLVPVLREEGNQLYGSGDYENAANKYREALGLLDQLTLREKPGDAEWTELNKAQVPLWTNLAQCQFKRKLFYDAISSASEAISRDPTAVKALFRRSKAYIETWDYDLAIADLRKVAALAPEMKQAVDGELRALESRRSKEELKQQRLLAGRMLLCPSPDATKSSST